MTTITLEEKTIQQIAKLLGIHSLPSPTSVVATPSSISQGSVGNDNYDSLKEKVNHLATFFLNETIDIAKIHFQHCQSMRFE